jgi:methyl halide transferase
MIRKFTTFILLLNLLLPLTTPQPLPHWLQKEIHKNRTKREEDMSGWERMWSSNGGLKPGQAFDATKPLPFIATLFQKKMIPQGKGIVPGCGRGYAPRALSFGGRHCIGLDVAPSAVKAAKEYLKSNPPPSENSKVDFFQGSFFEYKDSDGDKSFDFAYDYTFLCALQPEMREQWASTYARLLKDDGVLMTVVFPITGHQHGPPFALTVGIVGRLLRPHGFKKIFEKELNENEAHADRANGKSRMVLWCRTGKDIDGGGDL